MRHRRENDAADEKAQLEALRERIEHFKNERHERGSLAPGAMKEAGSAFNTVIRLLSELAAGIGFGLFIGYWLDRWTGMRPLFIIVFLLLGLAAAVRNIIRGEEATVNPPSSASSGILRGKRTDKGGETCGNPPNDV